MSTVELRNIIVEQLSHIDDISFLKAIKTIIESKVSEKIYRLSDQQKARIEKGREELAKGQTIPDEAIKAEVDQWIGIK